MHLLCPHCHNPVEIVRLSESVNCPSCGSHFNLAGDSTVAHSPAGERLGRFELLEVVGQGAFGTVYKARDPQLDRVVAIKILRPGNTEERFLREARSTAQLRHPSIIAVHEVSSHDGTPYLVSDFAAGTTLADHLSAGPLEFRTTAEIIAAVAEALHHAHTHGVIHRDIKPSNIMIGEDRKPCLMDFGLAKRADEITLTVDGQVLGTPAYMPPEQARGDAQAVDGRSDIYSLGAVLYQMLTGELPFRGTQRMLLHQVLHDSPKPPRRLNDRIPRDLETICLKALEKNPTSRYSTANDLADDLKRHLGGEPIRARPRGRLASLALWAKRKPGTAAFLALSFFAFSATAALVVGAVYHSRLQDTLKREQDALARAERYRYFNLISRALRAQENKSPADELLAECPEELRNWEWYYIKGNRETKTLAGHTDAVTCLAFSSDGTRLVSGSADKTLKLWDTSGVEIKTFAGHASPVTGVAFSPDGRIASSSKEGIRIWNQAGETLHTIESKEPVLCVAYSPDGKLLASGSDDKMVRIWDSFGREVSVLSGHPGSVSSVCFSPDGTSLVSGDPNQIFYPGRHRGHEIKVWNLQTSREVLTIQNMPLPVTCVRFSPDGKLFAGASTDETIRVWDTATGRETLVLEPHSGSVHAIDFSRDGERLACGASAFSLWDAKTGQEILSQKEQRDYSIRKFFIGSVASFLKVVPGHSGPIKCIAFSPSGELIASGGEDKKIVLWFGKR